MPSKITPLRWIPLMLVLLMTSACGYMDQDLLLDDESVNDLGEEHITLGGMHIHGTGHSGCGGSFGWGIGGGIAGGGTSSYSYGSSRKIKRVSVSSAGSRAALVAGAGPYTNASKKEEDEELEAMSPEDIFILNHTTVEAIAETGAL